jgi:hypothetical protein
MEKNQRKIVIFGNFEMSRRCHCSRKLKIEHAVTKDMAKTTFMPGLIGIDAFFHSFIAV